MMTSILVAIGFVAGGLAIRLRSHASEETPTRKIVAAATVMDVSDIASLRRLVAFMDRDRGASDTMHRMWLAFRAFPPTATRLRCLGELMRTSRDDELGSELSLCAIVHLAARALAARHLRARAIRMRWERILQQTGKRVRLRAERWSV